MTSMPTDEKIMLSVMIIVVSSPSCFLGAGSCAGVGVSAARIGAAGSAVVFGGTGCVAFWAAQSAFANAHSGAMSPPRLILRFAIFCI